MKLKVELTTKNQMINLFRAIEREQSEDKKEGFLSVITFLDIGYFFASWKQNREIEIDSFP